MSVALLCGGGVAWLIGIWLVIQYLNWINNPEPNTAKRNELAILVRIVPLGIWMMTSVAATCVGIGWTIFNSLLK